MMCESHTTVHGLLILTLLSLSFCSYFSKVISGRIDDLVTPCNSLAGNACSLKLLALRPSVGTHHILMEQWLVTHESLKLSSCVPPIMSLRISMQKAASPTRTIFDFHFLVHIGPPVLYSHESWRIHSTEFRITTGSCGIPLPGRLWPRASSRNLGPFFGRALYSLRT